MKVQIIVILSFLFLGNVVFSQQLEFKNPRKIYFEGKKISKNKVEKVIQNNAPALELFQSGRVNRGLASVMAFNGGFGVGYKK